MQAETAEELAASGLRPALQLVPLQAADIVQWQQTTHARKPPAAGETGAYKRLAAAAPNPPAQQPVTVTGPLKQTAGGYELQVWLFEA